MKGGGVTEEAVKPMRLPLSDLLCHPCEAPKAGSGLPRGLTKHLPDLRTLPREAVGNPPHGALNHALDHISDRICLRNPE